MLLTQIIISILFLFAVFFYLFYFSSVYTKGERDFESVGDCTKGACICRNGNRKSGNGKQKINGNGRAKSKGIANKKNGNGAAVVSIAENISPALPKIKFLNKLDIITIIGLTLVYGLVNFMHFGSFYQYQKNLEITNSNQTITIVLDQPQPLRAFYYATAYVKGHYLINISNKNNEGIAINDKDEKLGYPPYFRWNMIDLSNKNAPKTIKINLEDGVFDLSQIAVIDSHNQIVRDYQVFTNNVSVPTEKLHQLQSNYIPRNDDNFTTSTIFDEIYYATSAYQYLQHTSPDVWVHPQLGLLSILIGLGLFGMSSFAWRIVPSITTILLIPVIYIFAKRVFQKPQIAVIATILLMCEFMHFVMGRISSIEPLVTLFLVVEYYYLYIYLDNRANGVSYKIASKNLLYAGVFFGLAISSKWSALYSALMIFLVIVYAELFRNKNNFGAIFKIFIHSCLQFMVVPLLIYVLIYTPYAYINNYSNLWQSVYQLQQWMLNFNLGLTHATHPYASNFWSWPLDFKPLSIYYWQKDTLSSSIVIMGNPAIFWVFIPTTIFLVYTIIRDKKDYIALFLLTSMLVQYAPYAFVARISFIYYFYSVEPFLIISVCYVISKGLALKLERIKFTVYSYITIVVLLFILFYPALSGVEFPRSYTSNTLLWFGSWNF